MNNQKPWLMLENLETDKFKKAMGGRAPNRSALVAKNGNKKVAPRDLWPMYPPGLDKEKGARDKKSRNRGVYQSQGRPTENTFDSNKVSLSYDFEAYNKNNKKDEDILGTMMNKTHLRTLS